MSSSDDDVPLAASKSRLNGTNGGEFATSFFPSDFLS